jgi:asparagine synthase (glutamine-hydrolysing)
MCGIAGLISNERLVVERALAAMNAAQTHRGPDDCGTAILSFGDALLGFAHRRLSILDLSPCGHQPMVHPQTGDQLIFNGEIYNFKELRCELESHGERDFQGHSDTVVLLHALARWGVDCLRRLEGMYAFAFYEAKERRLLLARDPMGIKPLYVAAAAGAFLFASEVRALTATGLVASDLDMAGVAGLLAYGALQHPSTLFEQVRSFPPGSYQIIEPNNDGRNPGSAPAPPQRFWNFPQPRDDLDAGAVVESVRTTLDAAVRDHLVSDVPVGVFLSSGLDSSIVAALAARHTPHLRSFTVGFADEPQFSELSLATETARLLGLEQTEIQIPGGEAERAAVEWLGSMDQPSFDGLNVFIISKAVRAHGITVAISGLGGDELFGGYPSFADVPRLHSAARRLRWIGPRARTTLARAATVFSSQARRQKLVDMMAGSGSIADLYLQRRRAMSDAQLAALGLGADALGLTPSFQRPEAFDHLRIDERDIPWTVSQFESNFYQGNMLLRDGDVNGMAHSLEIRVPVLDQRMLNLMFTVPGRIRLPSGRPDKHLMRAAFSPLLRPALLNQGKRGFTLPIRRWMLGPLRDLCEQGLGSLKATGALRADGIDAVWRQFLAAPETPIWSRAFMLAVLGLYVRRTRSA